MSSNIQEAVHPVPSFVSLEYFQKNISPISLNNIDAMSIGGITYSLMGEGAENFFPLAPVCIPVQAFPVSRFMMSFAH